MPAYYSPIPPVSDIPHISLFSYLLPTNDQHPERAAFIDAPTGRVLTRGQLQHDARALAYGLRLGLERRGGLNVPRRSIILIFSGNSISVPLGILASLAAGLCVSMASSSLTTPELAYQIKDSGPTHLFVQPELVPIAIAALESLGVQPKDIKRRVLLLAPASGVPMDIRARNLLNLDDIMADNRQIFPEAYDSQHSQRTAMLFYSSGTTGLPKGVELTHYNLVAMCCQLLATPHSVRPPGADPSGDVVLGVMPHYHVYGGIMLIFHPLAHNSPSLILPKFEPEAYLGAIQRYRPTYLYIAPPVAKFLAESPLVGKYDMSSVKSLTSSAAALSPSISDAVRKRLTARGANDLHIAQGFGTTEMSPAIFMTPYRQDHKPAASGILLPNIEARIINDKGDDVPEGQPGELLVRGPNLMKGYYKNPTATRKTIQNGWLHTGDIVIRDGDGYYFIVDRIKELIKYKGYQVSPVEVENILLTHPQVLDAAVVGVKEVTTNNELPRAYIVPRDAAHFEPGAKFTPDINAFVKERASHYKQLRGGVMLIRAIPKSPAGKVLRRELRTLAGAESPQIGMAKL